MKLNLTIMHSFYELHAENSKDPMNGNELS
jgi:hypothetical protein